MKSFGILAASALFGALVNAAPVNKRDIVWVTETDVDIVTVPVTMTVWVDGGYTSTDSSVATSTLQAAFYHPSRSHAPFRTSTSTTVAPVETLNSTSSSVNSTISSTYVAPTTSSTSVYVAPTTTSTSVYVAPTTSSTSIYVAPTTTSTSEYVAPTTSSTSVYVAPTTTSTSIYVAPTTSTSIYVAPTTTSTSVYVAPTTSSTSTYVAPTTTSSSVIVAPTTTEAPTSTYVASTTTSSTAAATTSSSSSSGSGLAASGTTYTGDLTWYDVGLGACGWTNIASDHIVAISEDIYDAPEYATANPNNNPLCGRYVSIIGVDGSAYQAKVVDRCTGCNESSLDLSQDFFNTVTNNGDGRVHDITWSWV